MEGVLSSFSRNEIVSTAFETVPEDILNNEHVRGAIDYLSRWFDEIESNWIDTDSETFAMTIQDAREEGMEAVREKGLALLADAQYRKDMYGIEPDLENMYTELYEYVKERWD